MKYTAKNYFIDLFIFGLSVWLPSIIYLVLYEQFKGGSDGKYDIISIISYISIALLFILPFIFGILFGQNVCRKSTNAYLTVTAIMLLINLLWNIMEDGLIVYLFTSILLVDGYFGNASYIILLLPALFYYLGAKLKTKKREQKLGITELLCFYVNYIYFLISSTISVFSQETPRSSLPI